MRRLVLSVFTVLVLTVAARADVLEDVKAAVDQAANSPPRRQRSFERTMGGLGLAVVGARLVWYRLEDKDCREARGLRCDASGWGGAAALASGLLLMTVFTDVPAAPSVSFSPRLGGAEVRAVLEF